MKVSGAASDGTKAAFTLGIVYEALKPLRDRNAATIQRSRLKRELEKIVQKLDG
jgi:hypothetical protein